MTLDMLLNWSPWPWICWWTCPHELLLDFAELVQTTMSPRLRRPSVITNWYTTGQGARDQGPGRRRAAIREGGAGWAGEQFYIAPGEVHVGKGMNQSSWGPPRLEQFTLARHHPVLSLVESSISRQSRSCELGIFGHWEHFDKVAWMVAILLN